MEQLQTQEKTFTREAACAYLNVSIGTFSTLCKNGKIKGHKEMGKKLAFTKTELDRFLNTTSPVEA